MPKVSRARKVSSVPTRIYSYGCRPAVAKAELVEEQFVRAHRYQNKLIEIEKKRRAELNALELTVPEIGAAQAVVSETTKHVSSLVSMLERHTPRDETLRNSLQGALRNAREANRAAWQALFVARKTQRKENTALMEASTRITQEAYEATKAAYGAPEAPYWGTALLVYAAVEAAKVAVGRDSKSELKFRHADDPTSRRIGVQLQGGLPVAKLGLAPGAPAADPRLQMVPAGSSPGGRRQRVLVRMRVGSSGVGNRTPVFAEFPIVLHRPLPPDGILKGAWVKRQRVGFRYVYSFQVMLESTSFVAPEPKQGDIVGIDVGWRKRDNGTLRVAMLHSAYPSTIHSEEVVLPRRITDGFAKVRDLQSIQDKLFNETHQALADWLDANPTMREHPLFEKTTTLRLWKKHSRMRELAFQWKLLRQTDKTLFADKDTEMFEKVDFWRHRSRHLFRWERELHEQCVTQRQEFYRVLATRLARQYGEIKIENIQLARLAQEHDPALKSTQFYRQCAANASFLQCVKLAAAKTGAKVTIVEAKDTTRRCNGCGSVQKLDYKKLEHTCKSCGETWDQDANAAKNIAASEPVQQSA